MGELRVSIRRLAQDPFEEDFLHWVNAVFGQQKPRYCPSQRSWVPPTDVYETQDAIHIRMELAGVREEDIEVKLTGRYLIVRGKRDEERNVRKENYYLMEIPYGVFQRVFALPETFQSQDVTAKLKDGFLTIVLKKPSPHATEFRIEIQ